MSDTPRTDQYYDSDFDWNLKHKDFSKELERELTLAKSQLTEKNKEIEVLRDALQGLFDAHEINAEEAINKAKQALDRYNKE